MLPEDWLSAPAMVPLDLKHHQVLLSCGARVSNPLGRVCTRGQTADKPSPDTQGCTKHTARAARPGAPRRRALSSTTYVARGTRRSAARRGVAAPLGKQAGGAQRSSQHQLHRASHAPSAGAARRNARAHGPASWIAPQQVAGPCARAAHATDKSEPWTGGCTENPRAARSRGTGKSCAPSAAIQRAPGAGGAHGGVVGACGAAVRRPRPNRPGRACAPLQRASRRRKTPAPNSLTKNARRAENRRAGGVAHLGRARC